MKKKQYRKEITHYDTPKPETPYLRAKQEWDHRLGSARVQASNWRFVAVLSLLIALVLLGLLIASWSTRQTRVFVAQVTQGGRVVNVAPLKKHYQPTQAQREYFVAHFIKLFRSLPLDPVVAKQNWMNAYHFMTQRSATEFNQYMKQNNPEKMLGKETVTVSITDINPMSADTFQVDWNETIVDSKGKKQSTRHYSGVFTTVIKQPTNQAEILHNPLGVYIANFNVSTRDQNNE